MRTMSNVHSGPRFPTPLEELLKQDEKLGRFTSSLNVCHTKAITSLAEYGTKCL